MKVKHAGKPAHAKSGLERDDSAMEETLVCIKAVPYTACALTA